MAPSVCTATLKLAHFKQSAVALQVKQFLQLAVAAAANGIVQIVHTTQSVAICKKGVQSGQRDSCSR